MTRKRIAGFTGVALATLGFIILIAGYATLSSKWDDENCCKQTVADCPACRSFGTLQTDLCQFTSDALMEYDGCCYSVSSSPSIGIVIFGIVALAAVVLTSLILECGDKICCECCQKCTAIILGIQNIVAVIMVIIIFVVLAATEDSDTGCADTSVYKITGTNGTLMAATVFLLLGSVCSCVVTFIECCCDDAESVGGAQTAST